MADTSEFWDEYYEDLIDDDGKVLVSEWFIKFSGLQHVVLKHLKPDAKVMSLGCGNSNASEDLLSHGASEVVNIDISKLAIKQMQEKYKDNPALRFIELDGRDMHCLADETFDLVFDKGTLDTILCYDDGEEAAAQTLREMARVLKPDGVCVVVSYSQPMSRCYLYGEKDAPFQLAQEPIHIKQPRNEDSEKNGENEDVYCYVIKKR